MTLMNFASLVSQRSRNGFKVRNPSMLFSSLQIPRTATSIKLTIHIHNIAAPAMQEPKALMQPRLLVLLNLTVDTVDIKVIKDSEGK